MESPGPDEERFAAPQQQDIPPVTEDVTASPAGVEDEDVTSPAEPGAQDILDEAYNVLNPNVILGGPVGATLDAQMGATEVDEAGPTSPYVENPWQDEASSNEVAEAITPESSTDAIGDDFVDW